MIGGISAKFFLMNSSDNIADFRIIHPVTMEINDQVNFLLPWRIAKAVASTAIKSRMWIIIPAPRAKKLIAHMMISITAVR